MSYRWSAAWARQPLGQALTRLLRGERFAVPRVGGLFPGISTPIPAPGASMPMAGLLVDRSHQLLARYDTLYVPWSGGTDSSLVATLLLAEKRDQRIIVADTAQAAQDAPAGLRDDLLRLGAEFEPISAERMREVVEQGGMVVTGTHADSILIGELVDQAGLWSEILSMSPQQMVIANLGCSAAEADRLLVAAEPLLAHMPLERTGANVAFWLDFACLWDRDEPDLSYRFGLKPPGVGHVAFFNTDDFQRWAVRDAREKVGEDWATHKGLYRRLIEAVVGRPLAFVKNDFTSELPRLGYPAAPGVLKVREDYSLVQADLA